MEYNKNTLTTKILKLRKENNYTQKHVAEHLGVDKSTYAHYEAGRRFPNVEKLTKLANLYGLNDYLLGSDLPIEVTINYPTELLDNLEKAINGCKRHTNDYSENKEELNILRTALKPVLIIKDDALDLPAINIQDLPEGTITKRVRLDMRAEMLIKLCLEKQSELIDIMY